MQTGRECYSKIKSVLATLDCFFISPILQINLSLVEIKNPDAFQHQDLAFAERGGFEPPVQLPVRQFSKLVVSATHPSLQIIIRYNRM
jgi:hypothetical protein